MVTLMALATSDHVLKLSYYWSFVRSFWWKVYSICSCLYIETNGYIPSIWDSTYFSITCISSSEFTDCSDIPPSESDLIFSIKRFWNWPLIIEKAFPLCFLEISLSVLIDPPFSVVLQPFITGEDNLERFLDIHVCFLYLVFDLFCLQYSIQVVDGSIRCKRL